MAVKASLIRFTAAAGLLLGASACDLVKKKDPPNSKAEAQLAAAREQAIKEACASPGTFSRLKEIAFDQAVRIRNADPANLDTLAAHSVVRMEQPVVKSRDEELNITVCTGRFILELPPGAQDAFDGDRRLVADIEYAAQAAADRSGLVYQMTGAEPIVHRLAAFDLKGGKLPPQPVAQDQQYAEAAPVAMPPQAAPQPAPQPGPAPAPIARQPAPAPRPVERRVERPEPRPRPVATAQRPQPRPQRVETAQRAEPRPQPARRANPSFNCRYARSRSEQMVCSNSRLAARDRQMSSMFYSGLAGARPRTRAELRRSRDRFLAYRERCRSEECVARAYEDRMDEIRDIMAED